MSARILDMELITENERRPEQDCVAEETRLDVVLDGFPVDSLWCSPGFERELALGHLLATNMLPHPDAWDECKLRGRVCEVTTKKSTISSFGGGARTESIVFGEIVDIVESMVNRQQVHLRTGATHAAIVSELGGGLKFVVEDVSRASAVEKAIGHAVLRHVSLGKCLLATTGRLTGELVQRCGNTGIAVLASRAVATDLGVGLAVKNRLTLLGAIRRQQAWLYHEGLCRIV